MQVLDRPVALILGIVAHAWQQQRRTDVLPGGRRLLSHWAPNGVLSSSRSDAANNVFSGVLKVFSVASGVNFSMPWTNKPSAESTGSAFYIGDGRILTNAHVIADSTFVTVRKHGDPHRYAAKVIRASHEADLALLAIESLSPAEQRSFFENLSPLSLCPSLPSLRERVEVVGYPTGGDNISVTQGCVSRIELQEYVHAASRQLAVQIDAAINPGNSGGPVLNRNSEVVGVAFQNLNDAENIGFAIPINIVRHFLDERGTEGFAMLGATCQATDNASMRKYLGLDKIDSSGGVLVNMVFPTSAAASVVRKDDVLLEIDGHPIARDGTVVWRGQHERISFDCIYSSKFVDEVVRLKVLRSSAAGREVLDLTVPLGPIDHLVPTHCYGSQPRYVVFAGLVFMDLVQPYLHEFGENWQQGAPRKLVDKALYGIQQQVGERVVVLSSVLVDHVTAGYSSFTDLQVKSMNGIPLLNVQHLHSLLAQSTDEYLRFDLDEGRSIVMERAAAFHHHRRILEKHRIPFEKNV